MDVLLEAFQRIWENLMARPSGPMAFRFVIQPLVATTFAILDGVNDGRAGREADANDPDQKIIMTIGAVAAIAGLLLLIWPGTRSVAISWLIGVAALLVGALLIYLASRVRQAAKRVVGTRL